MIKIYKTDPETSNVMELTKFEKNCWINVIEPDDDDIKRLSNDLNIKKSIIKYATDEEERARLDEEDDIDLVIVDIPAFELENKHEIRATMPLAILHVRDSYIVTICLRKTPVFDDFIKNKTKFSTEKKSRFTIQIIYKAIGMYIKELQYINDETSDLEGLLSKSTSNKDLIKLMHLQKSLVYFTTSLQSNDALLDKMNKNNVITMYQDDEDLLEDAIIENKQAIEMTHIYSEILNSTINVFGTIISNNLNGIMKFLAGCTIVISIPTMVSSFMGMNVPLGNFTTDEYAFWIIFVIAVILSLIVAYILKKKDML